VGEEHLLSGATVSLAWKGIMGSHLKGGQLGLGKGKTQLEYWGWDLRVVKILFNSFRVGKRK